MPLPQVLELPNPTTPGEEPPAWYAEPARKVAQFLGNVLLVAGVVLATLNELVNVVPDDSKTWVTGAIAAVAVVVKVVTVIQGQLTRDRVYSPTYLRRNFGDPDYPGGANVAYPAMPSDVPAVGDAAVTYPPTVDPTDAAS